MKITNPIRKRVGSELLEKAYPKAEKKILQDNLIESLIVYPEVLKAKKVAEDYKEYVCRTKTLQVCSYYKDEQGRLFLDASVFIELPFSFADYYKSSFVIRLNDELKEKDPQLYERLKALLDWESARDKYYKTLREVLFTYTTSSRVIEDIPESKEIFDDIKKEKQAENNKGLVKVESLNYINNALSKGEK